MNEPAIRIEGLEFSYGRNKVLRGVDLSVPRGSIFGFLGRNGAGKTTTIKLLLGLLKPEAGVCRVDGLDSVRNTIVTDWIRSGIQSRYVGRWGTWRKTSECSDGCGSDRLSNGWAVSIQGGTTSLLGSFWICWNCQEEAE
ncbi:MAG: ATP-binding cassette domain-containing protein [Planctomycetota bacterium]